MVQLCLHLVDKYVTSVSANVNFLASAGRWSHKKVVPNVVREGFIDKERGGEWMEIVF